MQLPNKLYSYKKSTLAQIPIVLDAIKNGPVPVVDFMSVMDCLYALGATDINDEGEMFICLQK